MFSFQNMHEISKETQNTSHFWYLATIVHECKYEHLYLMFTVPHKAIDVGHSRLCILTVVFACFAAGPMFCNMS